MNRYLRLIWLFISYRFRPPLAITDVLQRTMRVMPGDLDVNRHVNNGRYLTLVDLAIVELFLRTGLLFKVLRKGWRPMLGGSMITYRRGLRPFARYTLRFELESWDARWNYFRFEFVDGGKTAAIGYVKGAMVGRDGWLDNLDADALLGASRVPREHRPALQQWIAAEQALAAEVVR